MGERIAGACQAHAEAPGVTVEWIHEKRRLEGVILICIGDNGEAYGLGGTFCCALPVAEEREE